MDVTRKVDQSMQAGGGLAELCSTSNFPFNPYGSLNFPQTRETKPKTTTSFQGFLDYSINCNFEMPRNVYNANKHPILLLMTIRSKRDTALYHLRKSIQIS